MRQISTPLESFGDRGAMAADLEEQIRSGLLASGSKLPSERELGLHYKISRPMVRESLRGLAERGYVEIHPGRGSFVRAPEVSDLARPLLRMAASVGVTARQLVDARLILETAAARAAAVRSSAEEKESIEAALAAHRQAGGLREAAISDLDFHTAIVQASGNPLLGLMFGSIRPYVYGLMLRSLADNAVSEAGDPLHGVIADHICREDADGAAEAMREHLLLAMELYGEDLDKPLNEVLTARGIDVRELT